MNRDWFVLFHLKDGKVSGYEDFVTSDFFRINPAAP